MNHQHTVSASSFIRSVRHWIAIGLLGVLESGFGIHLADADETDAEPYRTVEITCPT